MAVILSEVGVKRAGAKELCTTDMTDLVAHIYKPFQRVGPQQEPVHPGITLMSQATGGLFHTMMRHTRLRNPPCKPNFSFFTGYPTSKIADFSLAHRHDSLSCHIIAHFDVSGLPVSVDYDIRLETDLIGINNISTQTKQGRFTLHDTLFKKDGSVNQGMCFDLLGIYL
jgi:hypothetical protein